MICCFTGHRNISTASRDMLKKRLFNEILELVQSGYSEFISGGARGFDILAALVVLAVRKKYPEIKLKLILPCADQDKLWNSSDRLSYQYVLDNADSTETLHESYTKGCMHERNRKMIDSSDICIAYLTQNYGGTKSTVDYALKKNKKVVYIK